MPEQQLFAMGFALHFARIFDNCNKYALTFAANSVTLFFLENAHLLDSRQVGHPAHICAGTGLTPPTSAPGLGSPRPHLRRDWAHPAHICAGTGPTRATSALEPGSPPATSAPGLGSRLP